MATRRSIAEKIEKSPEIDAICLTEGPVLVIQVKSARQELEREFTFVTKNGLIFWRSWARSHCTLRSSSSPVSAPFFGENSSSRP
jgi:hypothetical protein